MKKLLFIFGLAAGLVSCSDDSATPQENEDPSGNNVVLLKVDFQNNTFEGGKMLSFEGAEGFTISSVYHEPGDFGDITLKYDEVDETIFSGTIVWAGTGQMTYPDALTAPEGFPTVQAGVPMPGLEDFALVEYSEFSYYPEVIDYDAIWASIDNLQIVKDFRNGNPDGKVHLFLYTPGVAIGDPADWDWYVILNNNPGDILPN